MQFQMPYGSVVHFNGTNWLADHECREILAFSASMTYTWRGGRVGSLPLFGATERHVTASSWFGVKVRRLDPRLDPWRPTA